MWGGSLRAASPTRFSRQAPLAKTEEPCASVRSAGGGNWRWGVRGSKAGEGGTTAMAV